ncbi:hypothetical protein pb186bvf_010664 [Paramecium bursaria]
MSLNWLLVPQYQKLSNGYFLNHDNLVLANTEEKQKLIFYFIAQQTPEKLSKDDYEKFTQDRAAILDLRQLTFVFGVGALTVGYASQQAYIRSAFIRRPVINSVAFGSALLLALSASWSLSWILFEPHYVTSSKVVSELGKKYNFSIFDFALAKKEAHLKQLRRELTNDSQNVSHA